MRGIVPGDLLGRLVFMEITQLHFLADTDRYIIIIYKHHQILSYITQSYFYIHQFL